MGLRNPEKSEIRRGNTLEIINRAGETLGIGTLIDRCPSKLVQDNLPYVKNENRQGPKKKRSTYMHIWSYERWLVEWVSHSYYRKGMRTCVEVNYYVKTTTDYRSGFDINFGQECSEYNRYIFIEEQGVLVTEKASYPKIAVQALNRISKSFNGELVVYTHNKIQTREHFELNGVRKRILAFLDTERQSTALEAIDEFTEEQNFVDRNISFQEAIAEYVERVDAEDFLILAGNSHVEHARALRIDPKIGLRLLEENKEMIGK